MLDDMVDHLVGLREAPLWQRPPIKTRHRFNASLPVEPTPLADAHGEFVRDILPYAGGNLHPGFMGWVQGAGTPVGMLAEMLAGGLNGNLGGRDHMPIEVERQVIAWTRDLFRFPPSASGIFLTGASQANFVAVLIARAKALGGASRVNGIAASNMNLVAYASSEAHSCIPRALDMAGIGAGQLRLVPVDGQFRIDLDALRQLIAADRRAGLTPFLIVGTAGSVNVGAIDDLTGLADVAEAEGVSFHVDGALAALGMMSPKLAASLTGIERCDTLAFDFHKWGHAPYDAGFLLARDGERHRAAFATEAAYLSRANRGMAGGEWWPCDYGPDLSRGFRALKVWFTLKTHGTAALGASMEANCALARRLAALIEAEPELELLAPVALNIVCFAYRCPDQDARNAEIVCDLQEAGRVAPSITMVNGRTAIRAAIVNHRTEAADVDALMEGVLAFGRGKDRMLPSGCAA